MPRRLIPVVLIAVALAAASTWADPVAVPDAANRLTVYNAGIGGNNTNEGRARFDRDVLAHKPDVVLIYFGLNDALNSNKPVALDDYIANLGAIIDAARKAKVTPILATIHPIDEAALFKRHDPKTFAPDGPQAKVDRYNAALEKLAAAKNVTLAPWAKTSAEAMANDGVAKYRRDDGVHLTPDGNALLARCFVDAAGDQLEDSQTVVCFGDSVTRGKRSPKQTYPEMLRRIRLD